MVNRECSAVEFCELKGSLTLAGLLPNDGLCLLTDAEGRAAYLDLGEWSNDQLPISPDDRDRMQREHAAQLRKDEIRRRAAALEA